MATAGLELLSAADASNIEIDSPDQVNAFLLAGTLEVGGFVTGSDTVDLDRLRAAIDERIAPTAAPAPADLVRFTQRVRLHPRPLAWEGVEPDLSWHVRCADPVEGEQGFEDLVATLMTTPLPLDRPLWELLVVPGATPTGPGIVLRLHHCVSDGVGAVRLVRHLFGAGPEPPAAAGEPPVAEAASGSRPPSRRRSRVRTLVTGVSRVTAVFRATVPRTVLLGPIGPHRGVALVGVPLEPLAVGARARGATVNDALLAAVAAAVEAALRADGRPVPPVLPTSVPVALPDRGSSGNAVGVMLAPLPTGLDDVAVRLDRIAAATRAAKDGARSQGTFELTRTRWGSRAFAWLARRQRFIALFVTNVRGPSGRMHLAGAPLVRAWPVAPIQGNVRFGVAAMSYDGRLGIALHVDADAVRAEVARQVLEAELGRIAALPDGR
jgi:diacylglycerol O-acyltransferase